MSLLKPGSKTLVEDAGLIADALVIPSGGDIHWDESAKNFIEGVILHVATWPAYEGRRNLVTVRDALMKGAVVKNGEDRAEGMDGLKIEMDANDVAEGVVQSAAADFFDKPPNEYGSVLSTARRHTKFLDLPAMRTVLSGHDFDLTALKTAPKGMTVYLCLPAGRMGTCNRWLRMFVNLALEAMERQQAQPGIPVLLCLDEFAMLGHMRQIEDAAGQIAGFGCKLWPIIQDLTQLQSLYKERWQTFMANAGVLQFFGNNDVETLEYIQKRLGRTSLSVKHESDRTYDQDEKGATGVSRGIEVHDLLTAEEAGRFFARRDKQRRQLIIGAAIHPVVLERVLYYDHPAFKGNYDVWR
jgi:type IV secretion system protein VirD4